LRCAEPCVKISVIDAAMEQVFLDLYVAAHASRPAVTTKLNAVVRDGG
jgi:hypothetical protein